MTVWDTIRSGAALAALYSAWYVAFRWLRARYRMTLGSRRVERKKLQRLGCGVTLEYVTDLFGPPVFRRSISITDTNNLVVGPVDSPAAIGSPRAASPSDSASRARPDEVVDRVREHTYRLEHSWLQLLIDNGDAVSRIAITATDPKLRLPMDKLTFGMIHGILGDVAFAAIPDPPMGVRFEMGARRFSYLEYFYFGNPGAYQSYLLALNDTSTVGEADIAHLASAGILAHASGHLSTADEDYSQPFDLDGPSARAFRGTARANTLVIVRADQDALTSTAPHGPDLDHVRVLPKQAGLRSSTQ